MRHPLVKIAAAVYPTAVRGKKRESVSTTFENARNFPATFTRRRQKVPIFCICRRPYDKEEYVQYCKCRAWYHTDFVEVPESAVNTKRKWGCQKCKDDIGLKPKNILASIIQQQIAPAPPPPSSDIKSRYRELLCKYSF